MTTLTELQRIAATVPQGVVPAEIRVTDTHLHIEHDHLIGTRYREKGIQGCLDGAGNPLPNSSGVVSDAMRDIRRRHARTVIHDELENDGIERPWIRLDNPPAWAMMTHPLFAYALTMNGMNDLPAGMIGNQTDPSPGVRVGMVQDLMLGRARMDPEHAETGKVGCDETGAVLILHVDLPETTRNLLPGHALGALLQLRPCGDPHLDAVVNSILIKGVRTVADGQGSVEIEFIPTRWIAPSPAPHGVDMKDVLKDAPVL